MGFIQTDRISIKVAGELVEAELRDDLTIIDIDAEMDTVAAEINWWSGVLAAARAEAEQLDALYRQWRAKEALVILDRDKTLAEWKVRLRLESSPKFMEHKNAKALAIRNIEQLEGVVIAFRTKAELLRSKGAMLRSYVENEGMHTPTTTRRKPSSARHSEVKPASQSEKIKKIKKNKNTDTAKTKPASVKTEPAKKDRSAVVESVRAKIKAQKTKVTG
jgi:hypothetical protein